MAWEDLSRVARGEPRVYEDVLNEDIGVSLFECETCQREWWSTYEWWTDYGYPRVWLPKYLEKGLCPFCDGGETMEAHADD